ncbi:MAG TPA: protoporphyrinogen oxidase [Thermoanaerobaculia bacterium]|jgi:oxygen-dependent protoporphyrinogen oxidase|nr:protoporphyrinogen oxidase [Thermoanaerobaculia bacterium]
MIDVHDVLIVGAGISGLTAAFRLRRAGLSVLVIEASERVGGAIETYEEAGFRFELGPNTVLESHPEVSELLRDAGLADGGDGEKIVASPAAKRRYLWKGDRLEPLPGGPPGLLRTRLFSFGAKLRLLREPWIRLRSASEIAAQPDETVAAFVRRRLGSELLDFAVGPFVSGVYAGDPERLAVRWAVPKIFALEQSHGSLIRGAIAGRKGRGPGGAMFSFRDGLETLPRRLAREIGDVRTGWVATAVRPQTSAHGRIEGFRVETAAGPLSARRVVLAVPADVAARLLDEATGGKAQALGEIPYAPVAVVSLGVARSQVAHPLDGFGFLAPRRESLRLLGCLFPSTIFPNRAPKGHVALSAFLGGRTDPEVVDPAIWNDDRLLALVREELGRALGLSGRPAVAIVRRWPRAIPQYEVGHGRFVALAEEIERDLPGLHFAGNFLQGVSVPDCIQNASQVAVQITRDAKSIKSAVPSGCGSSLSYPTGG